VTTTNHDYLLARLVMRHYWVWLAFTTELDPFRQTRCQATKTAIDLLGVTL
jgi:hypothetical protein